VQCDLKFEIDDLQKEMEASVKEYSPDAYTIDESHLQGLVQFC